MADFALAQPFIGLQAPRIPFIRFEQRAIERRREDGTLYYVDVDYALVTAQGSRDTVEKVVAEWLPAIRQLSMEGNYPAGWAERIQEMYKIWKATNDTPVVGTPIKNWPAISPAEYKILSAAGVMSIEDLAAANEEFCGRIGMGARRLKQMAIDWVQAASSSAPLVGQLDALRQSLEVLTEQMKEMKAENAALKAQLATRAVEVEELVPIRRASLESRLAARKEPDDDGALVEDTISEELNG